MKKSQNLKDVNVDEFFEAIGDAFDTLDRSKLMKIVKFINEHNGAEIAKRDMINIVSANFDTLEEIFANIYLVMQVLSSKEPHLLMLMLMTNSEGIIPANEEDELYISKEEYDEARKFAILHFIDEEMTPPETFKQFQELEECTWKTEIIVYVNCITGFLEIHKKEEE